MHGEKMPRRSLMVIEVDGDMHEEAAKALKALIEGIPGLKARLFTGSYSSLVVYPTTEDAAESYEELTDIIADIVYLFEKAISAASSDAYINVDVISLADRNEDVEDILEYIPELKENPFVDLSEE